MRHSPMGTMSIKAVDGFTLVEAIIALGLFSMVILASGAMLFSAMSNSKNSTERFVAATRAEQQMELLQAMPFDAVLTGSQTVTDQNTGKPFTTSWTVGTVAGNAAVKTIVVTTTWPDTQSTTGTRSFRVNSVRYRN